MSGGSSHWNSIYEAKGDREVSWFELKPAISLELIKRHANPAKSSLVDIGGGASRLVDGLLAEGMRDIGVLDLSATALDVSRARLGPAADNVEWIVADVTSWQPNRTYDFWHDRAAFHFLTGQAERAAYIERLNAAVRPGGHAVIATFAANGPTHCSGLEVQRYDPEDLADLLGASFELIEDQRCEHTTPWGSKQAFQFSVLQRQ